MAQQLDDRQISYLKDCAARGLTDTAQYAKDFLAPRFPLDWSSIHKDIWEAIDARVLADKIKIDSDGNEYRELIPKYQKICIVAPRGIGKTSIAKTVVDKAIRYGLHNYIMYIGKSEGFAISQTDNIKRTILQNNMANAVFPNQDRPTTIDFDKLPTDFSKKAWMINDILVMPRGWGQPIRGQNVEFNLKTYRPTLFVIDDLEDPKEIRSDTTRKGLRDWFFADVEEAIPPEGMTENYQFIYIDTLKHQDSLVMHLNGEEDWKVLFLPIAKDDGKWESLAPDFTSTKKLREKYLKAKNANRLNSFYQEHMATHTASELKDFTPELFKYYKETDPEFITNKTSGNFINVAVADPAKTAQLQSADSAICVWGIDLANRKAYLRDYDHGKWHPAEFVSHCFMMAQMYGVISLGIETTGLDEWALEPFTTAQQKLSVPFPIEALSAHTGKARDPEHGKNSGKVRRIGGMYKHYQDGIIYHNVDKCKDYETQLKAFPSPDLWDIIDAASYLQFYIKRYNLLFEGVGEMDNIAKQIANQYMPEQRPLPPGAGELI